MPRYRVTEKRCYTATILIDAADEEAATWGEGDIIDTFETDSYGEEHLSTDQVPDGEEFADE